MSPNTAAIFYCLLIVAAFWLDREVTESSPALWIPVIWVALASSRSVSQWLQMQPPTEAAAQVAEGNPVDRAVYTGLLVLAVLVLISRRRRIGVLLKANGPIILFFLYCLASVMWSDFPDVAFKRWTKAVGDFAMVLVVLTDHDASAAVRLLLSRVGYVLLPLSVLFIKYYPDLGKQYGNWDYKAHYVGVTLNKNALGVICLVFGLGALWRLLGVLSNRPARGRSRRLIAPGFILALTVWLSWMANSMTSLACLVLTAPLVITAQLRSARRRRFIIHGLVAAVIVVSVSALFWTTSMLQTIGRDPTLTDRTEVWSVLVGLSGNPIVGTGFESFWLGSRLVAIWRVFAWGPLEAHNGYLEIFLNLGWLGIALLAVVLAHGYRTVMAGVRRGSPTANLMLAYFVVGVVYNCTEAAFFRMMAPAWIFLLLAITRVPEGAFVKSDGRVRAQKKYFDSEVPIGASISGV